MLGTIHTLVLGGPICPHEKCSCTSPHGARAQASVAGDAADCCHPLVVSGASSTDFLAEASARPGGDGHADIRSTSLWKKGLGDILPFW